MVGGLTQADRDLLALPQRPAPKRSVGPRERIRKRHPFAMLMGCDFYYVSLEKSKVMTTGCVICPRGPENTQNLMHRTLMVDHELPWDET